MRRFAYQIQPPFTTPDALNVRPVDTAAMEAALAAAGVSFERGVDPDGRPTIAVADRSSEEIGAVAFRAGVQLAELSERRASLEDAYIRSTEGHIQYQAQPQDTPGGQHRA